MHNFSIIKKIMTKGYIQPPFQTSLHTFSPPPLIQNSGSATVCTASTRSMKWEFCWWFRRSGLIPETEAEQDGINVDDDDDEDNRLSPTPRSPGQRSRSRSRSSTSRPMRLFFNTDELTDGTRRSHVHVRSAVLRLHWNGHLPPQPTRRSKLLLLSLTSRFGFYFAQNGVAIRALGAYSVTRNCAKMCQNTSFLRYSKIKKNS